MDRIVLLTDFGNRDPYAAIMRGVLASRCDTPVHDLTHEIPPFDVFAGAWFLGETARWWPEGTIFVSVVDPGVGTARRIVAASQDGRSYLAPDNGLLTFVLRPDATVVDVQDVRYFLPAGSNTFHGRDRFAPLAAALARGLPVSELGPGIDDWIRLPYQPPDIGPQQARGTVVAIDQFGNCITDIAVADLPFPPARLLHGTLSIGRWRTDYDCSDAEPFLIVGSRGSIEISVAGGDCASTLGIRRCEPVVVVPDDARENPLRPL